MPPFPKALRGLAGLVATLTRRIRRVPRSQGAGCHPVFRACRLVIRFGISEDVRTYRAVSRNKDFSSRDLRMVAAQPIVREIALAFD